jgi:hypothetical protein
MSETVKKKAFVEKAFYNSTIKAMKVELIVDDTIHLGMDIPYDTFTYQPGMDIDQEMEKTANLMIGKFITIQFNGEKGEAPLWEV